MAATYWNASTGVFDTAGNWTNGVPGPSNTPAVFDGRSQQSVTSGLDRGTVQFQLNTTRDYRGDIGAVGNSLIWNGGGGDMNTLRGRGNLYLAPDVLTSGFFTVDALGAVFFTVCKLKSLWMKSGAANLASTAEVSGVLQIMGVGSVTTIEEQAAAEKMAAEVIMLTGILINKRITNETGQRITMSGGTLKQTGVLGSNAALYLHGGRINYAPLSSVSGNTPDIFVLGGLFDFSGSAQVLTANLEVGVDGTVKGSALQTADSLVGRDFRQDFF